jgi:hypothetical protein
VSWTVRFSEAVTGVGAGDFQLAKSGLGSVPAITGVTGSGSSYTVTASTGSGSGTLGLNLVDHDSIRDLAGNPLGGIGTGNGNFRGQVYTIDRTPPPPAQITAHPPTQTNSTSASFSFTDSEAGVSFQCKLDGGTWAACSSPANYSGLAIGEHNFNVRAVDVAGNRSSASPFEWHITSANGLPFTASGNANGLLYPGAPAVSIPVRLTNPNSVPIFVTSLTATIQSANLPAGCSGFQVTQSNISATQAVQVPANGSVTLPTQGASTPTIRMLDTLANQDPCQRATISLTYSGSAHS